jgi:hypothetical protein
MVMIEENVKLEFPGEVLAESRASADSRRPDQGSVFNYEEILFTAFNELDLQSDQVILPWKSPN